MSAAALAAQEKALEGVGYKNGLLALRELVERQVRRRVPTGTGCLTTFPAKQES